MKSTNFKDILEKCKEGANSMEEVYSELAYLTTNYDKEIEKLQKQIDDEKTRANNEEFVRHEAQKDLEDMRKLQGINFSVIVGGLIEKPKKEFESQLQQSMKKFTATIILLTIICMGLIIGSFFYFQKNNIQINQQETKSFEIEKLINEMKKENESLKEFIKKSIEKPLPQTIEKPKIDPLIKEEEEKKEIIIINTPKEKSEEKLEVKENPTPVVENQNDSMSKHEEQDQFLEKVLTLLVNYDTQYKLSGKNNSRILYKMFLLDLAPFKHESVLEEIKLFAKQYTYIPKESEIKVWDKQMLQIYTKMLEKIKDLPESKITPQMRAFHNYKQNDATVYSGWEYLGEDNLTTKESLEKEIQTIKAHIELNSK